MRQPRSGWLTIHPSGRWYLHAPNDNLRLLLLAGRRKWMFAKLGPFSVTKRIHLNRMPYTRGRIRLKVRWSYSNHQLTIGPLIGILTVSDGSGFRGNKENFKDIFLSGKRLGGIVFVFTPEGINWAKKMVRGYLYDETLDTWTEHQLPFPHVVYNRIPTRKLEKRNEVSDTIKQLASFENVTFFNPSFFNKHALFRMLEKTPEVSSYLPETGRLESLAQLKSFVSRHPFVYLKPVLGKAGEGIMRLEKINRRWRLRQVQEKRAVTYFFPTVGKVWGFLRKQIKGKRYIIQQGIPLARYKGRPFDVRVLVQKNGSGQWGVTGIGIRRAGAGSITTHVPRGGSIQSTDRVLSHLFKEQAEAVRQQVEQTALTIAASLNDKIENLAEMSMDLGLTDEGKLWFFEANAKPEKFDEPNIRKGSLSNLIRYSQYVSQLGEGKGANVG
ncbi:YheC/YheD family protein [Brevibacillus humidisoli]|uniref:YheC/YheD family endospore coat-associated protein n=1 Tax=Brevibacillus humidisoli TaxID=2895522 RepID=UPI001E51B14E|nr:YheC/YheD family protein [Brevibacillus humidisoli]UFJ41507.1 YheC/YheD family protein [Brevibacillus humidisoli]